MLASCLPEMLFYKTITNFIDAQSYFAKIQKLDHNTPGLATVVKTLFGKEVCKGEQVSDWEKRPLRLTQ